MDHEHWFDRLNKDLVRAAPRRRLLGAAGALLASLALGRGPVAEAAKKRKHKKKKHKKKKNNGKRRPQQCQPTLAALCAIAFFTSEDIDFCKDKCARCREAGTAFCIHNPDDEHPKVHATCCPRGEVCCPITGESFYECCPPDRCCEVDGRVQCLEPGETCCPGDEAGYCQEGSQCCRGGQGCQTCDEPYVLNSDNCECECPVECIAPRVLNPETCECECPAGGCPDDFCSPNCIGPGAQCCGRFHACVNTLDNPNHCGGCDQPCTDPSKRCCDGACVDIRFNNDHCGGNCEPCPDGLECCHGQCRDPQQLTCCRDGLPTAPWCAASMVCCTNADGAPACCAP